MTWNTGGVASPADDGDMRPPILSTKGHTISQGKRVHKDHVDRGEPLIYSLERWRSRYNFRMVFPVFFIGFCPIIMIVILVFIMGIPTENPMFFSMFLSVLSILMVIVLCVLMYISYIRPNQVPPGVYSKGIELFSGIASVGRAFLPYSEIEKVDRPIYPWYNLRLYSRHTDRKWYLPLFFYTGRSVEIIKDGVERQWDAPVQEGPPKLVLYSARGPRR